MVSLLKQSLLFRAMVNFSPNDAALLMKMNLRTVFYTVVKRMKMILLKYKCALRRKAVTFMSVCGVIKCVI